MITNKTSFFDQNPKLDEHDKYITNAKKNLSASIVHSKGGKVSEDSVAQVDKLVKYFEKYTGIFLEEMVCDFIKDESSLWWFIGCKAFKIDEYRMKKHSGKPSLKYFLSEGALMGNDDISEVVSEKEGQHTKDKVDIKKDKSDYTKLRMCRFC